MLFSRLGVYEDVIYEYYDKRIKVLMEDPIHKVHKRGWYIYETKWHDKKLVMTIPSAEGSLRNVILSHSKLVVAWPEIYLRKETWTLEFVKYIVDSGKRVLILHSDFAELAKIDAYSKGSILFLYEQH